MDILIFLCLACLFCVGVHYLTRADAVAGFWQKVVSDQNGDARFVLALPLSECLFCMSSFYGAGLYGGGFGYSGEELLWFVPFVGLLIVLILAEVFSTTKEIEIQIAQKVFYFLLIGFFCYTQYPDKFFASLFFIIALAGLNKLVESVLSGIESAKERNQSTIENSVDQTRAVEEIIKAINKK